jgi:hypothetical protein
MKYRNLTILQYQNITPRHHLHRLWLSSQAFEKQLAHLVENGFDVLDMTDAVRYMKGEKITEKRPIALSFDNGYEDLYDHAFPMLAEYRLPCTLLLNPEKAGTSALIGGKRVSYLGWEQLRALSRNDVRIGVYEDAAWNINQIPEHMVMRHIVDFKNLMEDKLGMEVRYSGVKEGVPNQSIRRLLRSQGYDAFLTECPTNQKPDVYAVGRVQVDDDDFNIFLTKVSRTYLFFKDKKSWKYIREYSLDKLAHKLSEAYDRIRS